MIWRLASPTAEERVNSNGSPYTWGDYTEKIVSILLARHVSATTIICTNDPYDYAESIKDDEYQLRIQGQGCWSTVIVLLRELLSIHLNVKSGSNLTDVVYIFLCQPLIASHCKELISIQPSFLNPYSLSSLSTCPKEWMSMAYQSLTDHEQSLS